jgi:hypothetical protein
MARVGKPVIEVLSDGEPVRVGKGAGVEFV